MDANSSSSLTSQSSGIRALASHDDDDFDSFLGANSDNSVDEVKKKQSLDLFLSLSNDNDEIKGNNDEIKGNNDEVKGSNDDKGVEFEDSVVDPDEEMFEKLVGSAQNGVFGGQGEVEGEVGSVSKGGVPVAKVSGEVDENEKAVPRARVVEGEEDEDEDEDEEWGDPLESLEVANGNGNNGNNNGSGGVESESFKLTNVDCRGVELDGELESDAVVDSINVDVEAVRPGVALVGVGLGVGVEDKKESQVEPVGEASVEASSTSVEDTVEAAASENDSVKDSVEDSASVEAKQSEKTESVVDEGREEQKGAEVEVRETPAFKEPVSVDSLGTEAAVVKYTEEGDAVVDSINVDAAEAVRSHVAVVGEVKGSGEVVESSEAEDVTPVVEDSVAEKYATEDPMAIKTDAEKSLSESDSVVDAIEVNVVEAIRSGVAVVGESEGVEFETKEIAAPVTKNVTVANDFAPLTDPISTEVAAVPGDELEKVQTNEAIAPRSVENSELLNIERAKSETDSLSKELDPSGPSVELQFSGDDNEKIQVDNVDDEPVASSISVEGEKAGHRSYASVLADGLETKVEPEVVERPGDALEEAQTNDVKASIKSAETSELLNVEKTKLESESVSNGELDDRSTKVEGEASQRSYASVLVNEPNAAESDENQVDQPKILEDEIHVAPEEGNDEGSDTDEENDLVYFGNGSTSRKVIEELETHDHSGMIDGQVVTESDEGDSDEEGEGNELFDSAALAALLKAASGAGNDPGTITVRSQDGSRLFSMERPVGLAPSLPSARPAIGSTNSSIFNRTNFAPPIEDLSEEDKKKLEIIQQVRVKFLRLVQRVGFTADHALAAQVLYKLTILAGRHVSPIFNLDNAKQTALQLEAEGKDDLDFSLNILVLGKSGVGKSAIINSMFGEEKVKINAFEPETTSVNVVYGTVDGVKIRFIDAPGLKSSAMEQGYNRKVLASVKNLTKKYPPDVMFYVDRLDSQTRDLNDLPVLKTISNSLGSSIWRNAIVTLTHASSAPPDGPSGAPLSYEVFVAQRSHIVQQSIGQAVGDIRLMNLNMMNPVSLVENHSACRKNREGQKILPNGQAWRPQLLLLCYSVKILSEASAASKSQDPFDPRKLFGFRARSPPLPYLLSSLLQPRAHPKLSPDLGGDNVDSDIDLDDLSDSDQEEEEDEYDQLPPFKPLKKSQMAKLSSDQKKAYFEEYDYRVKLLQRKQWREELKRIREAKSGKNVTDDMPEDYDGENGAPAAIPVPLPDMTLPPSFDSDNPAYRYRFLEPSSQFLARPVLDPHGWDHDCGYEGVNVEHSMGIAERFPASFTVQVNKDKKDFNVHLDSALSAKHGENGSSLLGFDVQTIGKQYAYIVRGETKFKNLKKNKTAAGVTVTFLGENVATGLKLEDQIILGKRLVLVGSTGTVRSNKDGAYGANLEVRLREADYPIGQEQSSFTLSLMKWRGDLAIGTNLQSQVSIGRNSKVAVRAALNNKMSGQITVRTSSSDHLSLAFAGLLPIAIAIYQKLIPGDVSENYSIY